MWVVNATRANCLVKPDLVPYEMDQACCGQEYFYPGGPENNQVSSSEILSKAEEYAPVKQCISSGIQGTTDLGPPSKILVQRVKGRYPGDACQLNIH